MHPNAILYEIQQLYRVSAGLDSLAEQHPLASEALCIIAGSVRNTAALLEALVAMKHFEKTGCPGYRMVSPFEDFN
jgi:hypothetical protein